jgi:hypothetical protein
MAHRDEQVRLEFSVAVGGAADMNGRAAQPETGANDPQPDVSKVEIPHRSKPLT